MLDIKDVKVGDKLVYIADSSWLKGVVVTCTGFTEYYEGIRFKTDAGYESHCYLRSFERYVEQPKKPKEQSMKIQMNKEYRTRDGRKVRVLCVDLKSDMYPVVATLERPGGNEVSAEFTVDGLEFAGAKGPNDLIEYNPASELKLDQAIWVKSAIGHSWMPRHFAKLNEEGKVLCWDAGRTSHTGEVTALWDQWSATKPE